MREQYEREHPEAVDPEKVPNVLARTIGPRASVREGPQRATYNVKAGDTLVLVSRAAFRGPSVPTEDVAFAAAAYRSPSMLAERVAALAFSTEDSPYVAVGVLRFDDVDVSSEIDRLIDGYQPDPRHGGWLGDWARSHRCLPAAFDRGGVLGMKPDGTVLSVAWDRPGDTTREETSAAAHLAATMGASREYPGLRTLAPRHLWMVETSGQQQLP